MALNFFFHNEIFVPLAFFKAHLGLYTSWLLGLRKLVFARS